MSDVLQIPPTGGSRSDVRRVIDALTGGQLVALPSETGYLLCASPLQVDAVQRLTAVVPTGRLTVYVHDPEQAEDFVPPAEWSGAAQRLARRCWPGPLVLEFGISQQRTLLNEWSPPVQSAFSDGGHVRLGCTGQQLWREVGQELPWPLVVGSCTQDAPEERFNSADDLAQRCGEAVALVVDSGPPRYQERATVVRVNPGGWELIEEGIVGERTVAQLSSEIILFVCTGNTCRSPMAEAIFRKMLAQRLNCSEERLIERGYVVLSAGLATTTGMPASENSAAVLREEGIDLSGHHSQSASAELLTVADHIVTMTRSHRESILSRFPDMTPRVRLLSEDDRDVSDPFGGDLPEYERCRDEIREHLVRLLHSFRP